MMIVLLALALALQDNGTGGPGSRWSNIDSTAGFPGWRTLVRRHVQGESRRRVNHLCVIVGSDPVPGKPDLVTAYLYWPEQHVIDRLSNTDDTVMNDLLFGAGPIDLTKDVIRPGEETNLNPNAVTRDWVNRLIQRCGRIGTKLTVVKRSGK
jgi:hypothetical protein